MNLKYFNVDVSLESLPRMHFLLNMGEDNMATANNHSENTVGLLKSEQLNNCQKIPFF